MVYESLSARLQANSHRAHGGPVVNGCTCRLWDGNLNNSGYPRFTKRVDGKVASLYAHRASWELANGTTVPEGFDVDHLCVNPRCIEPRHLEAVTSQVNQARKVERRRAARAVEYREAA